MRLLLLFAAIFLISNEAFANSRCYDEGWGRADQAIERQDLLAIWDFDTLSTSQDGKNIIFTLLAYLQGERASSLNKVPTYEIKSLSIENEAISKGYKCDIEKMKFDASGDSYLTPQGTKSTNPEDAASFINCLNVDGGSIRIKNNGTPKKPTDPTNMDHGPIVDKSVLYLGKGEDTYETEAFKISDKGIPLPKSTTPQSGLKTLSIQGNEDETCTKDMNAGWQDRIMHEVHIPIK